MNISAKNPATDSGARAEVRKKLTMVSTRSSGGSVSWSSCPRCSRCRLTIRSVAAPISAARSVTRSAKDSISSLCGIVTFPPVHLPVRPLTRDAARRMARDRVARPAQDNAAGKVKARHKLWIQSAKKRSKFNQNFGSNNQEGVPLAVTESVGAHSYPATIQCSE